MKTLNLHNIRHSEVEERFLKFLNKLHFPATPFKIITGKSNYMHKLVIQLLKKNEYHWHFENFTNVGALIVTDEPLPKINEKERS
tara:strand:+ start:2118 stop:2372 length:255 start_codon:yes stop_codon:yes gene_type:complete